MCFVSCDRFEMNEENSGSATLMHQEKGVDKFFYGITLDSVLAQF